MYLIIEYQKKGEFIPWLFIHKFLLQLKSLYTKPLCCFFFLKQFIILKYILEFSNAQYKKSKMYTQKTLKKIKLNNNKHIKLK